MNYTTEQIEDAFRLLRQIARFTDPMEAENDDNAETLSRVWRHAKAILKAPKPSPASRRSSGPSRLVVAIDFGNAAMLHVDDAAKALRDFAARLENSGNFTPNEWKIRDDNGNTVGSAKLT